MGTKKKSYILPVILILLAAVLTGVGIYCYPKWKAAGRLQEGMTSACFSFELEVALDRQAMEAGQVEVLEKLARLTGFEEEAMFRFTVGECPGGQDTWDVLSYGFGGSSDRIVFKQ